MSSAVIKPSWNPVSISLMILGFLLFWPLGLAILAYITWGGEMKGRFNSKTLKSNFEKFNFKSSDKYNSSNTGNSAFDAYRNAEIERLNKEREKLEQEKEEFAAFMAQLQEARDKEEFEKFMKTRKAHNFNTTPPTKDAPLSS